MVHAEPGVIDASLSLSYSDARPIRTRKTRREVEQILREAVRAITGGPDALGFAKRFYAAFAQAMYQSIHAAFIAKSLGGTDELGFRWEDLEAATKAYVRMDARKGVRMYRNKPTAAGNKYRPTLTRAQDDMWRAIFCRRAVHPSSKRAERRAMHLAARTIAAGAAWNYVKRNLGAQPIIDQVKDKQVPILQNSHRLEKSLAPGDVSDAGRYRTSSPDQIYRTQSGTLTIGSSVPYSVDVDRLRALWPKDLSVWLDRAIEAGRDAIIRRLAEVLAQ